MTTDEDYALLVANAEAVGEKLRSGTCLKTVLSDL